jgi:hypothetical protein
VCFSLTRQQSPSSLQTTVADALVVKARVARRPIIALSRYFYGLKPRIPAWGFPFLLYIYACVILLSTSSLPTCGLRRKPHASKAGTRMGARDGIKPDGNEVHFICFEEQLAAIGKDEPISQCSSMLQNANQKEQR